MEGTTEMEIEEPKSKKFGLKNSIQTNFGNDYVFQIVPKDDWSSVAVSLSTKAVKLYSPVTGQFQGECKGHSDTINQIAFSVSSSPHLLHSCSSDGTIRAWDTRNFQQVLSLFLFSHFPLYVFIWEYSVNELIVCRFRVLIPALLKRFSAFHLEVLMIIFLLLALSLRF
jgi:WD40 repeat protein